MFIDTHVHLNDETILSHLDEVIKEAFDNDVQKMFVVGWDIESSKKALEIAHRYDWCYAIIGFHPCNIKNYGIEEYNWLEENAYDKKVVAIGEIGYDLHWHDTTYEEQQDAFKRQIEIAKRVKKPISVHSRDAINQTLETLIECDAKEVGGVIHSYSGSFEISKLFIKLGFVLGISGPVTFKNGRVMKEVVEKVNIDYLISETDSPYLTPHPYRGEENGPKYIPLIVEEIAKIKNISLDEVKQAIYKNVERIFRV